MSPCFRQLAVPALALLLAVVTALPAHADRGRRHREPGPEREFAPNSTAQRHITAEEAVAIVQRETGGRVLDVRDQGDRYRVKVLTRNGEVRVVYVDAATGRTR